MLQISLAGGGTGTPRSGTDRDVDSFPSALLVNASISLTNVDPDGAEPMV